MLWIVAAVAAVVFLPTPGTGGGQGVGDLVAADAPAVRAEADSARLFTIPLLARVMVVQHDPNGLSPAAQQRLVAHALQVDTSPVAVARRPIPGAIPVLNTLRLFPGSRQDGTTGITYLLFGPDRSVADQVDQAERYARQAGRPDDHVIGVTGPIPARQAQTDLILRWLPWVEVVTVAVVALVLGLYFRSFGAPLLTLSAAGIAYVIVVRVLGWLAVRSHVSLPQDLEPVIVVLLLGVITDYSVFFLSGYRRRLDGGDDRLEAARRTTAAVSPIVLTAGLIVAASTAALLAARLGFLRAFGPALGVTVLVSLLVAITFVPAVMAIGGRHLFAPGRTRIARSTSPAPGTRPRGPGETGGAPGRRRRMADVMTARPVAAAVALLCVAVLVVAAWGLVHVRFGFTVISGLPHDDEVARASQAAEVGFAPGVLSPTEVLLRGSNLDANVERLAAVQRELERRPGVAGVLGPALPGTVRSGIGRSTIPANPLFPPASSPSEAASTAFADLSGGLFVSKDGSAARLIVIMADDPLGPAAVDTLRSLERAMPAMLSRAGLAGVRPAYAGDTALADEAIHETFADLARVGIAALIIVFLLLVLYLRGLVAPAYLLAASVLALAASLGLTAYVFQDLLGYEGITYYIPFAAAVLLVSLGSDYNIFVVGRIWDEARSRPLRGAIAVAGPRAARTISVAGIVLAGSFAVLALVPLQQFREFAFVMAVGILLDTFLVRSLLVPSLIALFGTSSWWPWRGPRALPEREPEAERRVA
jgi:RND superfamily putative drug exporter